jgi:hypothetical protein
MKSRKFDRKRLKMFDTSGVVLFVCRGLAVFSDPIIRVVDALVGATNAMRIDAYGGEPKP